MGGIPKEAAEIQAEMARIRLELHEDVGDVVEQAREMADWRNFVKCHPWLSLGAAAAVGYLVVPSRLHVIRPDADTLVELAKREKLVVKQKPEAQQQASAIAPLVKFASSVLLRNALALAGQQAGKLWSDHMQTAPATNTYHPDPS